MNTEQKRALLPCPFCGGRAKEYDRLNANTVTCLGCGVKVRQSEMGQGDASECWNRRAALQSQDREDALRYRFLKARQDIDDEELEFAVVKNAHFDLFQSSQDLEEAIDHARRVEGEEK